MNRRTEMQLISGLYCLELRDLAYRNPSQDFQKQVKIVSALFWDTLLKMEIPGVQTLSNSSHPNIRYELTFKIF